ncbi:MAG TPA: hypothetical protein ENF81_05865 [Thermotogaceae bacterium]|nr:hypothetical protein [Thermotogaceae bacterium]
MLPAGILEKIHKISVYAPSKAVDIEESRDEVLVIVEISGANVILNIDRDSKEVYSIGIHIVRDSEKSSSAVDEIGVFLKKLEKEGII